MSNADPQGKFVWHELLTSDAAAATAFYTKVIPWKTQAWEQDASYSMWVAKNGPVGGIAALESSGAPHWLPYVGVSDVAATVESAKELGGRVLKEPTDMPNGGSYAVLADPQGAEFAVYQSGGSYNGAAPPSAGEFTWHELATSDAKAAMEFYTALFGWEAGPVHDMGPSGLYHLFLHDGNQYGGIYVTENFGGPNWLCYIGVDDAGKAVAAAKAAGGRVLNGPLEVPGGSWVAQVLDSEGVAFAVHESKMEQAAAAKPAASKPSKPKAPKAPKVEALPQEELPAGGTKASRAAKAEEIIEAEAPPAKAPKAVKPAAKAAAEPAAKPAKKPASKPAAAKAPAKSAAGKAKKKAAPAKAKGKAAKKAAGGKAKAAAKKAPGKKVAARKAAGKKSAAKKAPARKGAAKRAAGKKASAKRAPAKKAASRAKAKKRR